MALGRRAGAGAAFVCSGFSEAFDGATVGLALPSPAASFPSGPASASASPSLVAPSAVCSPSAVSLPAGPMNLNLMR
jgi:hypothetical protein